IAAASLINHHLHKQKHLPRHHLNLRQINHHSLTSLVITVMVLVIMPTSVHLPKVLIVNHNSINYKHHITSTPIPLDRLHHLSLTLLTLSPPILTIPINGTTP